MTRLLGRSVPARRAITIVATSALASIGLSFAIGQSIAQDTEANATQELTVDWDYRPGDLPELVAESPAVVLAEVIAVTPGEPIEIAGPEGDEPAVAVPSELIALQVVETIDGNAPATLTLYQVGGPGTRPEGAPAFRPGERHLLFVRPRLVEDGVPDPDGSWIAVAPDGQLERTAGELDAAVDGPIAVELDGDTLTEAKAEIAAAEAGSAAATDGQ